MKKISDRMLAEYYGMSLSGVKKWKKERPRLYAAIRYAYGHIDKDEVTVDDLVEKLDKIKEELKSLPCAPDPQS